MDTKDYKYLWTTEREKWVLVNTELGYVVVNKKVKKALVISNEELEEEIINNMIKSGNKIYNSILEAYDDN